MMLRLKLQYFGHLMWRVDSLEETLMLGGIGGRRRRGRQEMRWLDGITDMMMSMIWTWVRLNSGSWWWTGRPGVLQSMGSQRVRHNWATELTNLGGFIFECHIFLLFHTVHEVLKARMQNWFGIPSSSKPHFVRTLHHDLSILGGPAWHGSQFHWVTQGCDPHDHFS